MLKSLLKSLELSLSILESKEGKALYEDYMKAIKAHDEQLDKKAKGLRFSQLTIDRSVRDITRISDAYNKYILANPTS